MKFFPGKAVLGVAVGALLTQAAAASPLVDYRGYKQCEDNVARQFRDAGLMFEREYFLKREDDARIYFINGYVWDGNEREELQTTCVTTPNGRKVIELDAVIGEHADPERVAIR